MSKEFAEGAASGRKFHKILTVLTYGFSQTATGRANSTGIWLVFSSGYILANRDYPDCPETNREHWFTDNYSPFVTRLS